MPLKEMLKPDIKRWRLAYHLKSRLSRGEDLIFFVSRIAYHSICFMSHRFLAHHPFQTAQKAGQRSRDPG
jgi:hypothetical protein